MHVADDTAPEVEQLRINSILEELHEEGYVYDRTEYLISGLKFLGLFHLTI